MDFGLGVGAESTPPGRKRKVKCQLTDQDVQTCAECIKNETQCTTQPPETEADVGVSADISDKHEHITRLGRVEALLQRLVDAQEQSRTAGSSSNSELTVPASLWDDFLLQTPADGLTPLANDYNLALPQSLDMPDANKQSLVALLPSAQDAATIVANTTAWLWGAETPPGSVLTPNDTSHLLDTDTILRGSVVNVAKTLLLFALYMQQLPPNFDAQFLEAQSIDASVNAIVERVKSYILSHEDEACTTDGLECMTLLYLIQLNDGALRKSWITVRRVLDISRLYGLQNSFSISARNSSDGSIALGRRLWLAAVCGDCYCSMLLGLEPALGMAPFGLDDETWNDPLADEDANVQRRICLLVARISQRNAVGLHRDHQIFQEIDLALDRLQDSLPASWWIPPTFRHDRSLDSAKEPNRIICQLWFFQARIYANLPIAFGERTVESVGSLESCMEASRATLHRYLGFQHARDQLSRCRTVDQTVAVAATVLLLAKVQLRSLTTQCKVPRYDSDRALVEQVVSSFDAIGRVCRREKLLREGSEILSSLLGMAFANSLDAASTVSRPFHHANSSTSLETSCGPQVSYKEDSGTSRSGIEDIIVSSILPLLDAQSPASNLITSLLKTIRQPSSDLLGLYQEPHMQTPLSRYDTIDPTTLQLRR
ncbi:hypothetical protein G7046_g5727 [Stylonectria norvegica]|nr:hypothetical protein G7046_g5727 [Stylonectria norvegica]